MKRKFHHWLRGITAAVILAAAMLSVLPAQPVAAASAETAGGPGGGRGGRGSGGTQTVKTPLSVDEIEALKTAIREEYGALNLYTAVVAQFGEILPFSSIAASEQNHLAALIQQAVKYGVEIPANPGLSSVLSFSTLEDACAAGAAAEVADAELYVELMPVINHTDILRVFSRLQAASLENHLPAFEMCQ